MANFHFELVSPEKLVFSGDVEQVDVPGAEGDFGVLAGHAPFVTTLRPGILTVHGAGGAQKIVVLGGFAEVSAEGLTVLADVAEAVEDIDRESDRRAHPRDGKPHREAGARLRARQGDHAARSFQGSGPPPLDDRDALTHVFTSGGSATARMAAGIPILEGEP